MKLCDFGLMNRIPLGSVIQTECFADLRCRHTLPLSLRQRYCNTDQVWTFPSPLTPAYTNQFMFLHYNLHKNKSFQYKWSLGKN